MNEAETERTRRTFLTAAGFVGAAVALRAGTRARGQERSADEPDPPLGVE